MTVLKAAFVFLFIAISTGCMNTSQPQTIVPDAYLFPDSQIGYGKTSVYVIKNSGDTNYVDFFQKKMNGKTFLIQCDYDKNGISDSMVFLKRRLVEYYINSLSSGRLWSANRISGGVRKGMNGQLTEISEVRWQKGSNYADSKSQTTIIKDTSLYWNGKSYPAIITRTMIDTRSNFLQTPAGDHNFKMEVITYLCRHLGPVRRVAIVSWNDAPIVFDLVEIKDMQHQDRGNQGSSSNDTRTVD